MICSACCATTSQRAGDQLHPALRLSLLVMQAMRRWIFLTLLTVAVPLLVVYRGSDALAICFNTVAILFMTEIDNVCYAMGLGERARARVEQVGRVELSETELANLVRSKAVHIGLIVLSCLAAVKLAGSSHDARRGGGNPLNLLILGLALPFLSYWIGAAVEVLSEGGCSSPKDAVLGLVRVTGERLLSFVGIGMIILMSTFGTGGGSMTNDVPLNE